MGVVVIGIGEANMPSQFLQLQTRRKVRGYDWGCQGDQKRKADPDQGPVHKEHPEMFVRFSPGLVPLHMRGSWLGIEGLEMFEGEVWV